MEIKKIDVGPLETNCYLVTSDNEALVIDPGDEPEKILAEIKKTKAKVKYIILTHYHFDHVLAAQELKNKTGATILIHEKDKDFLDFSADRYLKENEEIKIGQKALKVIHSPGHTKGSICLLGDNEIFVGDLIFEEGYGKTDLEGGSGEEMSESFKKIKELFEKNKNLICYPGHGEIFELKDHFICNS